MQEPGTKLLSHRLREFAAIEQSASALAAACGSGARYLEIDTRVTRDSEILVYHDPKLRHVAGSPVRIKELDSSKVRQVTYSDGSQILSLEEALSVFRNQRSTEQTLCLDIKDAGFEVAHLELLRKYGLEENTCILSWSPQILLALQNAGCASPLVLCHCNLTRLGWLASLPLAFFRNLTLRVSDFVLLGPNSHQELLSSHTHGFQHAFFCQRIPESLCQLLSDSGGGICIHKSLLCSRLIDYCERNSLMVWTFSTTAQSFTRFASISGVDVVFCDDAPSVIAQHSD